MNEQDVQSSLDEMLRDKRFVRLKQQRKQLCFQSDSQPVPLPQELMSLPPVPYRIAKALDPAFYRNVEMDLWLQEEKRNTPAGESEVTMLPISTRCLLTLPHDPDRKQVCFVVSRTQGFQVQVFVPLLRKK